MYRGLATVTMLLLSLCALCQTGASVSDAPSVQILHPNQEVMRSFMVGVGSSNILDTYLSPYNYSGTDFRAQRETQRMTKLRQGRVSNQSLLDVNFASNENHAGNIDEYAAGIRYSQGWFYNFGGGTVVNPAASPFFSADKRAFNVAAGLAASAYLGAVYIDRSGNNPAQAKADFMIDASAMATYHFRIARYRYLVRYQVSVPFIGIAFSPNYGQSYYEAFQLGNYDHNVVFAYLGNMPSMRHRLTLDIPIRRYTLRVGYVAQFNQSTFNHLKYHSYSHNLMVGFNKYLYRK